LHPMLVRQQLDYGIYVINQDGEGVFNRAKLMNLPYNTIFGGVSSFSKQQFLTVNGYSNTYWGWGGEDDDMYKRIIFHGMSINRPDHMTGKYKMIKHQRDKNNEVNPKNPDKLFHTRETMDKDGINTLNYTVKEIVKDRLYTFINVDIKAPKNILSVGMLKSV
uniref:Galactosyltransferase C-terminal domain-containing protein n=1 Tax=Takifugu rubripes TaxID=31033 RepID=A0A674PJ91_TAKRU